MPEKLPAPKKGRTKEVIQASRSLSAQQRVWVRCLIDAKLDKRKALKMLDETGLHINRATLWRWERHPKFIDAFEIILDSELAKMGITRSQILANVVNIAEDAMVGDEVYFKGEPTGEIRKDRNVALKAWLELGKTAAGGKLWGEEAKGNVVVNFKIDFSTPPRFNAEGNAEVIEAEYEVVDRNERHVGITDAKFGEDDLSFLE